MRPAYKRSSQRVISAATNTCMLSCTFGVGCCFCRSLLEGRFQFREGELVGIYACVLRVICWLPLQRCQSCRWAARATDFLQPTMATPPAVTMAMQRDKCESPLHGWLRRQACCFDEPSTSTVLARCVRACVEAFVSPRTRPMAVCEAICLATRQAFEVGNMLGGVCARSMSFFVPSGH